DGGVSLGPAVIQDDVFLEAIPVRAHGFALMAERDAGGVVVGDAVAPEEVVRVLVTDGDAAPLVGLEHVVLELPVPHPPADEHAVLAVAGRAVAAHDRALRTAAGVQAVPGVVLHLAVFHGHPAGDLKADAVAVVVADGAVADGHVRALEQVDPAAAAAVQ